ncbi:oxaloacetate decarboxylase subunit alpha [Tindallia californiensis]|uniref:Oxaloacetate decarboxylase, alpha subunit n=1 Tax=Tindallia californiensis TaxID=159292 RepID=A0A1H3NMI9_9FIRM|nr:oxaloacetate decarboxylase subunit alpha [Tindallia californiensis]SDY90121.1 oxaloacetate decarboxylase, alpha subunit [Tindallia californiensis]
MGVKFTDTTYRDAHQSLMATRMSTDVMLPIAEKMDNAGYHSLEMWGGATFDSCLRYLNEDPWERLRIIRKHIKKTKLQMLLRGQNILGYKHYADDVVEEFVKRAIGNGIDIIRVFDAVNDVRNLETAVRAINREKGHAQCCISYTISPVHNTDYYLERAKRMKEIGADSLCIKDMSGILEPYAAYDLVKALKTNFDLPVQVHTHYTCGLASMTYLKAIEAGADVVDTAISPMALGTSQPAAEPIVSALQGTEYDTGMSLVELDEIASYFRPLKDKYFADGLINEKVLSIDTRTLINQIPGGMMSNFISQLKEQNKLDKMDDVMKEVPRVREDLGYPPLVTPTSQIVGTQALFNVLAGERYKMVPKEVKDYVKGLYGQPAKEMDPSIIKKIIGDEKVITHRPADDIPPQLESIRNEMKEYIEQEEDVLSYALFPQIAMKFFKERWTKRYRIESDLYNEEDKTHPV